uniref:Uncharacterized protein n=1 Tax=Lepeophtheirus salmonis TaxID=72036 RepID=A0A0K2TZP6_LEPSM
MTETFFLIFC